jgi:hypothetical protein
MLTIYIETVNLECVSEVLEDNTLEAFLETHAGSDPVFISIDVTRELSDDSTDECIENVLYVPDLTRFSNLEALWINFEGSVRTSSPDGCLTLPNKVWMFALRNGKLCSTLKFGHPSGQDGTTPTMPIAMIALRDADLSCSVEWQTSRGHNDYHMAMMYCTRGNVDLTSVPSATYHESYHGIQMGYDMRGSSRSDTGDLDARIYFYLIEFERYCECEIQTKLKLMLHCDDELDRGIDNVLKTFFYSA